MPIPQATGLRPSIGPASGGTVVTIRGSHLGESAGDVLEVEIGGVSVLDSLEWESASKLKVVTPPGEGVATFLITTASGGVGQSSVLFEFEPVPEVLAPTSVGFLDPSSVWVPELSSESEQLELNPAAAADADPLMLGNARRQPAPSEEGDRNRQLLSHETFDPGYCLGVKYPDASIDDFERGLAKLERGLSERKQATTVLLNTNALLFVGAFQSLAELNRSIGRHRRSAEGNDITTTLEAHLEDTHDFAVETFTDIINRDNQIRQRKNTLVVLKRYRFLINLPKTLKELIANQEWAHAIQDIKKARETESTMFARVLEEVNVIGEDLRLKLYQKLEELPKPQQELQRFVQYLLDLGDAGDPGRHCIVKVSEFLDQQLSSEVATLEKSLAPKAVSRAKGNWNHLRSALQAQSMLSHHRGAPKKQAADSLFGSWKTSTHDKALSLATRRGVEAARRRIAELDKPPRMHFLERITQALCDHLPVLWKLGHSFQPVVLEDEAGRRTSRLFEDFSLEDHVGDGTMSRAKEMEAMCLKIVQRYSALVTEHFLGHVETDSANLSAARESLPRISSHVRSCLHILAAASLPAPVLSEVEAVLGSLQQCIVALMYHQAAAEVSALGDDSVWTPCDGGTHTNIVSQFEDVITATLSSMATMLKNSNGSADLDEAEVERQSASVYEAFAGRLEALVRQGPTLDARAQRRTSFALGTPLEDKPLASQEERWLCTMANCQQMLDWIAPRLCAKHSELHLALGARHAEAVDRFADLQARCMADYITTRCDDIRDLIDEQMLEPIAGIAPTAVRPFAKQILHSLVLVHSEAYSMCRSCVSRIMRQLVAAVADSVAAPLAKARLKGADLSQLHLDVLALQATLRQYDGTPSCWAPVINRISTLAAATGRTPTKGRRSLPTPGAAPKRRTLPTPGGGAKGAPANPRRGSRDAAASAKTAVLSKELQGVLEAFLASGSFQFACFARPASNAESEDESEMV